MATDSFMLTLGTQAPAFSLPDVRSGGIVASSELTAGPLLVMFICNHCPYVKHVQEGLVAVGVDYTEAPVDIVAISSNDADAYPDDAPDQLARIADEVGYPFPVLYDETQAVAKSFKAACTPDFFLFDAGGALFYRGQMDESRPRSNVAVTGVDLRNALDAVIAGDSPPDEQRPSVGCGIKWKPGNEPG